MEAQGPQLHPLAVVSDLDSSEQETAGRALTTSPPPPLRDHGATVRVVWEGGEAPKAKSRGGAAASPTGFRSRSGLAAKWGRSWWQGGDDAAKGTKVSAASDVAKANAAELQAAARPPTRRPEGALHDGFGDQPQVPSLGWQQPTQKFFVELRERHAQHEQRVLELLKAHQQHLENVLNRLGGGREAVAPGNTSVTGPVRPSTTSRRSSAPSLWQGSAAARSASAKPPGAPPLLPPEIGPAAEAKLAAAKDPSPARPKLSAAKTAASGRSMSNCARSSHREEDSESEEEKKQEDVAMPRRNSRNDTWHNDEAVGATELYRKKKLVDKVHKRITAQKVEMMDRSFCKSALALISHPRFEMFLAIIIILNASSIGVQADFNVQNVGQGTPLWMRAIDYTFTIIFTIELFLRILAEGTAFVSWRNRNWHWNMFDSLLVATAITGDVVGLFISFGTNVSVIRLLRVLRLARAIRLIRVLRFFKDLRVMITGIAQSAKSLLWASGLLLIIIYMYAICVLQVVGDHLETLQQMGSEGSEQRQLLGLFYGSLPTTVYTLFAAISGGHDWANVAEPLLEIHPVMGLMNMVYVGFAVFCVLNVITGVFVENAFKINNDDDDKAVLDMLESRKQWIHEIKDLFKLADKSNTGFVDWAEFRAIINDVRVQAVFHRLGLDVEADSAELLFELLDFGGQGLISLDDFAEGIQRVRGNARSIDMCQLLHDNRVLKRQLGEMMRSMDMLLCWQQGGGKMIQSSCEV